MKEVVITIGVLSALWGLKVLLWKYFEWLHGEAVEGFIEELQEYNKRFECQSCGAKKEEIVTYRCPYDCCKQ